MRYCGASERNVVIMRWKLDWLEPASTIALARLCSLGKSKLPSRSSSCMVAPDALPTPWIGGGGTTSTRASITSCIARFMPMNSDSRSCPLPRSLHGLSVT